MKIEFILLLIIGIVFLIDFFVKKSGREEGNLVSKGNSEVFKSNKGSLILF